MLVTGCWILVSKNICNLFIVIEIFFSLFISKAEYLNKILPADLAFAFYRCCIGSIANITNGYNSVIIHFLFSFFYFLLYYFRSKSSFGYYRTEKLYQPGMRGDYIF